MGQPAVRKVKQRQVDDAQLVIDGLTKNQELVTIRRDYYAGREFMNEGETFYEQIGIVIPDSVLLFGILALHPDLRALFTRDGIRIGGLGVFLLLAYATGHLVAAFGNIVEVGLWAMFGGMPSNWVTNNDSRLLTEQQISLLERIIRGRLNLEITGVRGMDKNSWNRIFQHLYRDVLAHSPGRTETFNGNYGLNRGLACAVLALAAYVMIVTPQYWHAVVALVVVASTYLYRAYRFGVHFAREVFTRFLLFPPQPPEAPKAKRKKDKAET
jgi:hypothetical protein